MTAIKPLRVGVIGTAAIARAFIAAVAPSDKIKVTAVASRDAVKADAYAREVGIARAFGSYEAMLADREIDAVYNPLPNSLHAEWTIKAAAAGKHILCEKPLAISGAEARAMFEAARKHGVHLVEAYPYLSQAQTQKALALIRAGAIGRLHLVRTSFGVPFSDATNIRLKPDLAGGSLMDAGSYALSFLRVIAGERPARVHAFARWTETGVDRTLAATIEFPSGLIGQIASSFATGYYRTAHIAGEGGTIETTFLNHPPIGGPPRVLLRRGTTAATETETIDVEGGNGFLAEANSFAAMLKDGPAHWTGTTEAESIDIAATLAALLQSARTGQTIDVTI